MEHLIELADKHNFVTHDGRLEEMSNPLSCDICRMLWLSELKNWFIESQLIYVQETCYDLSSWGFIVYDLDAGFGKGAPIIEETEEPDYLTITDALIAGLTEAFNHIVR